jgi:SAM-dependent methyltransferase
MTPTSAGEAAALAIALGLLVLRQRTARGRLLHRRAPADGAPGIEVRELRGGRELWFSARGRRMLQARVDCKKDLVSRLPYVDGLHLFMLPRAGGGTAPRVLFIGCGAGVGPRQFAHFYEAAQIDVVDIDPRVFEVAREFFAFEAKGCCTAHVDDGRLFLSNAAANYDRIVVDAFGANDVPARLCTEEFFGLCKTKLRRGGVCVVNAAGSLDGPSSALEIDPRRARRGLRPFAREGLRRPARARAPPGAKEATQRPPLRLHLPAPGPFTRPLRGPADPPRVGPHRVV